MRFLTMSPLTGDTQSPVTMIIYIVIAVLAVGVAVAAALLSKKKQ